MDRWVVEEFDGLDLGDVRLSGRTVRVLEGLAQRPEASLPQALGGEAELDAAYRLLDHPEVNPERILQSHYDHTLMRIMQEPVVLLIQDTTELNYTRRRQKMSELGPLNDENSAGMYLHPVWAVTPDRLPLGLVAARMWTRRAEEFGKKHQRKQRAFEEKESVRWRDGYQRACEVAGQARDTQVICVSDAEGDIYECFIAAQSESPDQAGMAYWITRAGQDRTVAGEDASTVWNRTAEARVVDEGTLSLSATPKRVARQAQVVVRATSLKLQPPHRHGEQLPEVTTNVVLVREEDPPAGVERIEWVLLTSLPVDTLEQVHLVIEYYACRWEIEVFFRVLKSGCTVEELQLETFHRLTNCLALYLIVAWRVLYAMKLGRTCPELPCTVCFGDDEWQPVWKVVQHEEPPRTPPALGPFIRVLARLGGYLNRKSDPPPGPKAMWIATRRLHDLALSWRVFGPASKRCEE